MNDTHTKPRWDEILIRAAGLDMEIGMLKWRMQALKAGLPIDATQIHDELDDMEAAMASWPAFAKLVEIEEERDTEMNGNVE